MNRFVAKVTVTLHFEGATTRFSNYVSEDHVQAH